VPLEIFATPSNDSLALALHRFRLGSLYPQKGLFEQWKSRVFPQFSHAHQYALARRFASFLIVLLYDAHKIESAAPNPTEERW